MSKSNKLSTHSSAFDLEEAADEPTPLPPSPTVTSLGPSRTRTKAVSDVTGMHTSVAQALMASSSSSPRYPNLTALAIEHTTSPSPRRRMRMPTSTDLITKFGYAPTLGYDDLKFSQEIQKHGGNRRERIDSGLSDMVVKENLDKESKRLQEFHLNEKGLSSEQAKELLAKYGPNELPEKIDPKWLVFCRLLWQPMPVMIWIAIVIELSIANFLDAGILLAIQFTNASISFYETNKAGNAIAALKNSLRPMATCKRDGKFQEIDARLLVPGDTVLLASGAAVPADCRVNMGGEIDVDQAALTGESLPVTFYPYDSCKMGSNVVRGETEATVEFTGADTFFGKTAALLAETHEASHLQKVLLTVMFVLVGLSLTLCLINFTYLLVEGVGVEEALTFTVVLLVASIPLAIEIVTTTTLAIGSKTLVKSGAIVARLSAIEDLASMVGC